MARPVRAQINPALLRWAQERAEADVDALMRRFPKLSEWEEGTVQPTLRQLESFADAVHVPIGYLFLQTPPNEPLPIPDFRTIDGRHVTRPSPNLLDMIYACQERQSWYREFAQVTRRHDLEFVGSANINMAPEQVAESIRTALGFSLEERRNCPTWAEALRLFIQQADRIGVLVMVSGVVFSNNKRTLNPDEFRGFALADRKAPLIFVNGADTKSAQMFTLAHELAHIWLGATALSDVSPEPVQGYRREEVWCNQVAAELLVPLAVLRTDIIANEDIDATLPRLSRHFKVSTLVILRRLLDVGYLSRARFDNLWHAEMTKLLEISARGGGGGDFYRTTLARVSKRFARALVESTLEGQTLYRDAFRMLGISKTETFNNLGREVGVML
jgi:Zn-dependent peptidase ImmA (M78 family)/transcriptional regulator with XRE-family HTH domain